MFEELSVRDVETELVGMAGHLAAGTCRFLQLLAEFDTREGWAGPGLRSCAHWLGWRVGMDARTARDHLRVAHALTRLPATTAAFATGRVSYSKVRALTRIADADTEHTLLGVALHGTASQLDGLVRAARAGADPRPATARRAMAWSRDPDGSLLVRLRIPAERGEQLLSAVQAELDATDPSATEHSATEHSATEHSATDPSADAESGSAEPPDAHTDPAAHHRHMQADRADLAARAVEHAPGPVLEPLAARRLDALLDLVTGERHPDPATLVVHLRLDDLDQTAPSANAAAPAAPDPGLHLVPDTAEPADNSEHGDSAEHRDTTERRATTDPACLRPTAWIEDGPAVAPTVAERITCTGAVQALLVDRAGNPLYLGRTRRVANRAQLRALRVRDGNRCTFPGCTTSRYLHAHHVRWWRHDGPTDLDNLLLICGFHHTLIHDHGYQVTAAGQGSFTFARPDTTPVPTAGAPVSGSADDLVAAHTARQIAIDGWTITPRWGGERLDPNPILRWLIPQLRAA